MFFYKFYEIFKNTVFAEHLGVTASDIRMQVVVTYNLKLFLHFVTMNSTFSLLRVLTLPHASMSPDFLHRFFFSWVIFSNALQDRFLRKIITKHKIKKSYIPSFHFRLLGEVFVILGLFLNFSNSIRIMLEPMMECV